MIDPATLENIAYRLKHAAGVYQDLSWQGRSEAIQVSINNDGFVQASQQCADYADLLLDYARSSCDNNPKSITDAYDPAKVAETWTDFEPIAQDDENTTENDSFSEREQDYEPVNALEEWRPIAKYEDFYEVSSDGRVRSVDREVSQRSRWGKVTKRKMPGVVLKHGIDGGGYPFVCLSRDGLVKNHKVHRLVLEAFVGPCPEGHEACHWDGNPLNNTVENLRWGTKKDNASDRERHGTVLRGSSHPNSKLSEEDVLLIRQMIADGISQVSIADGLGVSKQIVNDVCTGKTWAHLNDDDMEPVSRILCFYENDPDSMRRFRLCNQAEDLKLAMFEFDWWLRNRVKYNDSAIDEQRISEDGIEWLQVARDQLWKRCADYGIDLTED